MIFNSIPFLLFFPIVILLYYVAPKKYRYIWLLICSYFFYMCQDGAFVSLLILTTLSTYVAGILLGKANTNAGKNIILAVTVCLNIGILAYFKCFGLLSGFFGNGASLILPIGISFYTFQALSYIIDCYQGKIEPQTNVFRYALYVSFFPSILSGPINKASEFIPELKCEADLDLNNVKLGLQKMLWGYFLKLVIAARLTILVDNVYADVGAAKGASLFLAAVAYLFMLYCDFAGYSSIVIGASKILGINMRENFMQPFYSLSMGELWKRWHISLSSWLRNYLYFPLGGNRKGEVRKYINQMIIFIVSGIWHGVTMTFLVWGFLNGAFLVAGNLLKNSRDKVAAKIGFDKFIRTRRVLLRIGVYLLYGFTMIFFASKSMEDAIGVIVGMFTRFSIVSLLHGELFGLGLGVFNLAFVIVMAIFVLVADGFCYRNTCDITGLFARIPTIARWGIYLAIVVVILFSANLTGTEFIYSKM